MKTFDANDRLERQDFCSRLEGFLLTEHLFVEGALVISLNGAFGTGKTTLIEMWKNDLEARAQHDPLLPNAVVLNAWESDYSGDPLLALISALTEIVEKRKGKEPGDSASQIREAAKDAAWFGVALVGGVVSHVTGIDATAAGEFAEDKKKARKEKAEKQIDLLAAFEHRRDSLRRLKAALTECFGGQRPRAIVFVDELDRCRPDYAIQYLETIKHVFDVHGLIFVLAVDKNSLASSAKALYGADLNFNEYYRKFSHRNVDLPRGTENGQRMLIGDFVKNIFEATHENGFKRTSSLEYDGSRLDNILEIFSALELTPRQAHEAVRLMGHCLACPENQKGRLLWGYGVGVCLMAALAVAQPKIYHQIGTGSCTLAQLGAWVKQFFGSGRHLDWWGYA
ncbi:MAG: P-loop NTPase fold protein, partial [Chthoniobacter sp.]